METGKKRILLVDDEESFTRVVKLSLEDTGRFEVCTAPSVTAGFAKVQSFKPDLIVLDVIMPEQSGDALAEQLRCDEATRGIPVIFLTAITNREEVGPAGRTIGGQFFLAKPIDTERLLESIDERLAQAR
jgi:CheY-like chemotaxis protein